jgi:hypothetical protein
MSAPSFFGILGNPYRIYAGMKFLTGAQGGDPSAALSRSASASA